MICQGWRRELGSGIHVYHNRSGWLAGGGRATAIIYRTTNNRLNEEIIQMHISLSSTLPPPYSHASFWVVWCYKYLSNINPSKVIQALSNPTIVTRSVTPEWIPHRPPTKKVRGCDHSLNKLLVRQHFISIGHFKDSSDDRAFTWWRLRGPLTSAVTDWRSWCDYACGKTCRIRRRCSAVEISDSRGDCKVKLDGTDQWSSVSFCFRQSRRGGGVSSTATYACFFL